MARTPRISPNPSNGNIGCPTPPRPCLGRKDLSCLFKLMHGQCSTALTRGKRALNRQVVFTSYLYQEMRNSMTQRFVGLYARHLVRFSLSGLPQNSDLSVFLDGEDINWTPKPGIGMDRWHYDIHINQSLSGGNHEVSFQLNNGKLEGSAQLCSVEILEFGSAYE